MQVLPQEISKVQKINIAEKNFHIHPQTAKFLIQGKTFPSLFLILDFCEFVVLYSLTLYYLIGPSFQFQNDLRHVNPVVWTGILRPFS